MSKQELSEWNYLKESNSKDSWIRTDLEFNKMICLIRKTLDSPRQYIGYIFYENLNKAVKLGSFKGNMVSDDLEILKFQINLMLNDIGYLTNL